MNNLTKEELVILDLKHKRQYICFPIINRGEPYYNTLNETQKEELNTWYQEWLNVTETLTIPTKPTWLEE